MINILITEFIDPEALKILSKDFNVIYKKDIWENSDDLTKEINKFEGIIVRNKTNLNQSILEKAENLKYIGRLGVGLDNIDTEYCKKNNIFVQPATGMNADSVAEYVISSSLSLLKKTKLINEKTQSGQWPRTSITTNELKGKILGLIGFGDIAKKVGIIMGGGGGGKPHMATAGGKDNSVINKAISETKDLVKKMLEAL